MHHSKESLKHLRSLFAHNRYMYLNCKLITQKEYISNNVKLILKMSNMLDDDLQIDLIMQALRYNMDVDKFRLAMASINISAN